MHLLGLWLRLLIVLPLALGMAVARAERVQIVSSEGQPAFQEAVQTLVDELARGGVARADIRVVTLNEVQRLDTPPDDTRLVVTLGARALGQVVGAGVRTPVIAALIPRLGFERILAQQGKKAPANVSALYLDQPFTRQLGLLRLALPTARVVSVVWGPESVALRGLLQASAKAIGLQLRESELSVSESLVAALKSVITDSDALLAVPDTQVFNAATVSDILMMTYRARLPVVAFSPSYSKAGALLSLYTAPAQVGVQAATMALSYLQSNQMPGNEYPIDFQVVVNEYVARSLGLSLDSKRLSAQLAGQEKRP